MEIRAWLLLTYEFVDSSDHLHFPNNDPNSKPGNNPNPISDYNTNPNSEYNQKLTRSTSPSSPERFFLALEVGLTVKAKEKRPGDEVGSKVRARSRFARDKFSAWNHVTFLHSRSETWALTPRDLANRIQTPRGNSTLGSNFFSANK